MPRPTPPKVDFKIYVAPSCLSTPMDEEPVEQPPRVEPSVENEKDVVPTEEEGEVVEEETEADESYIEEEKALEDVDNERRAEPKESEEPEAVEESGQRDESEELREEEESEDEEQTPMPFQATVEDETSPSHGNSRRSSAVSNRRTSGRTEKLIQAAARAVVAHMEKQNNVCARDEDDEAEHSLLSSSTADDEEGHDHLARPGLEGTELSMATTTDAGYQADTSRRESLASQTSSRHSEASRVAPPSIPVQEDVADSSSTHDDVFSDRSPRSSLGSVSSKRPKTPVDDICAADDSMTKEARSPRISDLSQYEREEFVPTARGTPRPPFRTPSDVRAMQMSSPPSSVLGSPRSSKRPAPLPSISRLGSPSVSAQYSPKGRSTPPRFKSRKESAPLVLLHVTLLPLRWGWGRLLEAAPQERLSEPLKTLREAWMVLHERMGDTVLERGVLLPHPQNDYEVLEERLLEAMELPLRRRARILECGHYLGPANEFTLTEDLESEDEDFDARSMASSALGKKHWCTTCRNEIKYDALGSGKVFRVKVYASNGLMKAGAWAACWKEMERVDVEIEPIVEASVQDELERLAAEQSQQHHEHEEDVEPEHEQEHNNERTFVAHEEPHILSSSPNPRLHMMSPQSEDRRRRDEERLREIYGRTPPPPQQHETTSSMHPHPDSFVPLPTPPSPSEEAFQRRQTRRRSYQSASLPELLFEAVKVLMQDRKNVVIALLVVLALGLSVRGGPRDPNAEYELAKRDIPTVVVTQEAAPSIIVETIQTTQTVTESIMASAVTVSAVTDVAESGHASAVPEVQTVPGAEELVKEPEAVTSKETLRVVETVTETVKVTTTEVVKPEERPANQGEEVRAEREL